MSIKDPDQSQGPIGYNQNSMSLVPQQNWARTRLGRGRWIKYLPRPVCYTLQPPLRLLNSGVSLEGLLPWWAQPEYSDKGLLNKAMWIWEQSAAAGNKYILDVLQQKRLSESNLLPLVPSTDQLTYLYKPWFVLRCLPATDSAVDMAMSHPTIIRTAQNFGTGTQHAMIMTARPGQTWNLLKLYVQYIYS